MNKILILLTFFASILIAQKKTDIVLSGSLINDTKLVLSELQDSNKSFKISIDQNKKNPFLTGLMSFAIPGAGQVSNKDYLKAGIFAVVEIGAIILAITYDKKGDDQTNLYKSYANANWSAARYANWTFENRNNLVTRYNELYPGSTKETLDENNYTNLFLDENKTLVNWSVLNKLESDIGWYYSHKLEKFGEQQYYEMIGKYSQFNVGWAEFGDDVTKPYSFGIPVVDQFKYYSKERGKANEFYTVAKWAVVTIVTNHIVSAIDAAFTASSNNKKLNINITVEEETIGFYKDYYPQLNFSYKL